MTGLTEKVFGLLLPSALGRMRHEVNNFRLVNTGVCESALIGGLVYDHGVFHVVALQKSLPVYAVEQKNIRAH